MDGRPIDEGPEPGLGGLAQRLQALCIAGGWTVVTAESCTGGLVADTLTDVPGSSGYVLGGIVAYADAVKQAQLGVPADVLAAHGAVSAQVAVAMASGARERLGATFAVSVTGIAGPDGGSDAKPVGLTYVGAGRPGRRRGPPLRVDGRPGGQQAIERPGRPRAPRRRGRASRAGRRDRPLTGRAADR